MLPEHMDDGLTHVWALYWSASLSTGGVVSSTTGGPSSTGSVPQEEWFPVFFGGLYGSLLVGVGCRWGRLWADEPSGGSKNRCPEGIHAGFQWLLSCLFVML